MATEAQVYPMGNPQPMNILTAGGLLSKAAETAIDIYALQQAGKAAKAIGSAYPTGNTPPELAQANANAEDKKAVKASVNQDTSTPQKPSNANMILIVGGGVAVLAVVVILATRKGK